MRRRPLQQQPWSAQAARVTARANLLVKLALVGLLLVALAALALAAWRGHEDTRVQEFAQQPIPFSHKHHVGDVGLDCRFCHAQVERSANAGLPSTQVCLNCHSQLLSTLPMLEPLRESARSGKPIEWKRVHRLPDFVYFNHAIHVNKGVGCATCHGRVDRMPAVYQVAPLTMGWCINCHRNPANYVRPRGEVYTMGYKPPVPQSVLGPQLVKEYGIRGNTSCSTCHR